MQSLSSIINHHHAQCTRLQQQTASPSHEVCYGWHYSHCRPSCCCFCRRPPVLCWIVPFHGIDVPQCLQKLGSVLGQQRRRRSETVDCSMRQQQQRRRTHSAVVVAGLRVCLFGCQTISPQRPCLQNPIGSFLTRVHPQMTH